MKKILSIIISFIALSLLTQTVFAAYPKPVGYVNDFANTLSPSFKSSEEKKLSDYQKKTSNEIAVVTVNTTGDQPIEDYSIGLANQWKPGVSGKDNGVIILFAMQDHHDRIEIGCGLEGAFTDVQAEDILSGQTRDLMRAGKVDQAVRTTVDQVISRIGGSKPQPCKVGSKEAIASARASTSSNNTTGSGAIVIVFAIIITLVVIAIILKLLSGNGSDYNDDDSDTTSTGGFGTGALLGGALGYGLGRSSRSRSHDDDNDDDNNSSPSYSGGYSSNDDDDSSSSSGGDSGGFGGFSGGSFSGGGASGGW